MSTRESLIRERDELEARLNAIRRDYRRGLSADSSEQAIELENAETLAEIERVTAKQLESIQQKLAEGDWD